MYIFLNFQHSVFETVSHFKAQASLELVILLSQPPSTQFFFKNITSLCISVCLYILPCASCCGAYYEFINTEHCLTS
jgi:hypothetical protein